MNYARRVRPFSTMYDPSVFVVTSLFDWWRFRRTNHPIPRNSFAAERPPLRVDEGGAVRVGKSRISLDLVIEQYENGMMPEDMVRA
jgi:hypothetical protein